jgi:hypothetical protein
MRALASLLLFAAVGCGDDSNIRHTPDAPPGIDGQVTPDTANQAVTVTVTRDGMGLDGVVVYFQNADSSLVKMAMTDASGVASTVMAAGGSVTALDPFSSGQAGIQQNMLFTWEGVKPGDNLILRDTNRPVINVNVIAPTVADKSIVGYLFYTSCSYDPSGDGLQTTGTTATGSVTLYGCGGTADVLVTAYNSASDVVQYIYKQGVTASDGGTIDLSTEPYAPATNRSYTWTGTVAGTFNLDIRDIFASPSGPIWQTYNGVTPDAANTSFPVPAFPGAKDVVIATQQAAAGVSQRRVIDWGTVTDTFTSDFGSKLLPELGQYPMPDIPGHGITWAETGGAVQPDFTLAAVFAQRQTPPRFWQWIVAAPHTAGQLKFPTLPTDLFDYNFATGDGVSAAALILVKVPGGYDAARGPIFATNGPEDLAVGASGTLSTTELQQALRPAPKGLWKPARHGSTSKM